MQNVSTEKNVLRIHNPTNYIHTYKMRIEFVHEVGGPKVTEDDNVERLIWDVRTFDGHRLCFMMRNGVPEKENGAIYTMNNDEKLKTEIKTQIVKWCPIYVGINYFVSHNYYEGRHRCYIYNPILDKWIESVHNSHMMVTTFESIYQHLQQRVIDYDREMANAKHLKTVAGVIENFKSMEDLLKFASSVIEIAKK